MHTARNAMMAAITAYTKTMALATRSHLRYVQISKDVRHMILCGHFFKE